MSQTTSAPRLAAILQLVDDLRVHYADSEIQCDIIQKIINVIPWDKQRTETSRQILTAMWNLVDDATREALSEAAKSEHGEICACCRRHHARANAGSIMRDELHSIVTDLDPDAVRGLLEYTRSLKAVQS